MCQTLFQHARKRQTLRWTIDLHQSPRGRCTRPTGAKNHGAAGTGGLRTICKWSMLVPLFNYIIIILPMKMLIWGFVVHVLCSRSQHITRHIFQRLFRCRGSWWLLEDWNLAWTRRWMLPHWWSLPGAKTPRPGRCRCRSPRCVPVTFWSSFFFFQYGVLMKLLWISLAWLFEPFPLRTFIVYGRWGSEHAIY